MNKTHDWDTQQSKSAALPNFGKKYITEPAFLSMIGDVKGREVLELGSGNGYWLEILAQQGAHCTGVEMSQEQLKLAREKPNAGQIRYIEGNITTLEGCGLDPASYDTAIMEHVLLEISSKEKLTDIFRGLYTLLKTGGEVVIGDLHPFAPSSKPANLKTSDSFNYFSSGETVEVVSHRIDGEEIRYKDVHWTLEDLATPITQAGFCITTILEPRPSEELVQQYPNLLYRRTIPMAIMVKAIKNR